MMKILGILLILVISISTNILILNAEALVAMSFIIFAVLFYFNVKDTIVNELDNRAAKIKKEFDSNLELKKKLLANVRDYHQKQSSLYNEMGEIFDLYHQQLVYAKKKKEVALRNFIPLEINQKLQVFSAKKLNVIGSIQSYIVQNIYLTIENFFAKTKPETLSSLYSKLIKLI